MPLRKKVRALKTNALHTRLYCATIKYRLEPDEQYEKLTFKILLRASRLPNNICCFCLQCWFLLNGYVRTSEFLDVRWKQLDEATYIQRSDKNGALNAEWSACDISHLKRSLDA